MHSLAVSGVRNTEEAGLLAMLRLVGCEARLSERGANPEHGQVTEATRAKTAVLATFMVKK
jgi:hypothetical protein